MPARFSATDHAMMARALRLAGRGLTTTAPNPRVGCVIARDGEVVGEGWHQRAGAAHAEVVALQGAGSNARGACAWVTLEPCSHFGRTPPCADALIEAGITRVVAATRDPHPNVDGAGLERLRSAGIEVADGLMAAAARALNPGFFRRIEQGRPWVRVKLAGSLDGRAVGPDGRSQWITAAPARRDGHRWRARADALLTGIGTVLADDPRLDVRLDDHTSTRPVYVADSRGRLPADARLLASGAEVSQVVASASAGAGAGCERFIAGAGPDGRVRLDALLAELARREVNELHVEAGPMLSGALLVAGLVDELIVFQAACTIGSDGAAMLVLPGVEKLDQRLHFDVLERRRIGPDERLRLVPRAAGR